MDVNGQSVSMLLPFRLIGNSLSSFVDAVSCFVATFFVCSIFVILGVGIYSNFAYVFVNLNAVLL